MALGADKGGDDEHKKEKEKRWDSSIVGETPARKRKKKARFGSTFARVSGAGKEETKEKNGKKTRKAPYEEGNRVGCLIWGGEKGTVERTYAQERKHLRVFSTRPVSHLGRLEIVTNDESAHR